MTLQEHLKAVEPEREGWHYRFNHNPTEHEYLAKALEAFLKGEESHDDQDL